MPRYYDMDKLKEMIEAKADTLIEGREAFLYVAKWLDSLPPADVVEVVRCKDCTHYIEMKGYDYNGRKASSCIWHGQLRRENDYCGDGIRKGGK